MKHSFWDHEWKNVTTWMASRAVIIGLECPCGERKISFKNLPTMYSNAKLIKIKEDAEKWRQAKKCHQP